MKFLKISIVVAALALAGCSWLPWQGGNVDAQVTAIVELCKEACKFEPTAQSVAAMLAAANQGVAGVAAIAHAICDQVNKSQTAPTEEQKAAPKTGECPWGSVNGVCIEGKRA